jgi:formylglycine-generating enzyme required for sulfatase activity
MPSSRRIPSWPLIVATGVICLGTLTLESLDLFPVWRFAVQWSPAALPSSRAVSSSEVASGLPVLSLSLNDADLLDPATGLIPNKKQHGEEWERPGSMSYFDKGRLVFASGVGVRIHGGGSRITSPRPGFRLYFRRKYGPRELPPGILFGPQAQPVRRLVVHDDARRDSDGMTWHLVNPLAYDIAKAAGAIAPETQPARLFVNGEYYGPYVLTERFDERYFAAHWGYDDILLSQQEMDNLLRWVLTSRPFTMKEVSQHVNVDNLARWFLAVAFCATRDAYQGPGQFLDQTKESGGWFWVNWDMDQSFRQWDHDTYQYLLERIAEGRRGRNRAEPRALILTHLIAEDADFRRFFMRIVQNALNHQFTDAFLEERYEHYLKTAAELRVSNLDYVARLRPFLAKRRAFFRLITEQWLNLPTSLPVTVSVPGHAGVIIDGERVGHGYAGMYSPALDVTVDVDTQSRPALTGWRVNERFVSGRSALTFTPVTATRIEPVFQNSPSPAMVAPLVPRAAPAARSARIVWRDIPSGSSWMGCVPTDRGCDAAEKPRVQTHFAKPFQMMDREVSAGDFQAFAAQTSKDAPRQPEWYADDTHPVVNVTWDEAQAYCAWAGGRLPTEAEWEYAARGGLEDRLFPWGDEFTGQAVAIHNLPGRKYNFTAPVASFAPNGYGLHDMAGNVWEWTSSEYRPTHATEPEPAGRWDLRTIKGGGWNNVIRRLRNSQRAALSRSGRHNLYVGFRCVRS